MARRGLFILLVALAAAGGEPEGFEVARPTDDWEFVAISGDAPLLKAHLRTTGPPDAPPVPAADVKVWVAATDPARDLAAVLAPWRDAFERNLGEPDERTERAGTLAGRASREVDVRAGLVRVTWSAVRVGKRLYVLEVRRTHGFVADATIADEVAKIRASLTIDAPPAAPPPAAKPPAAPPAPARKLTEDHWRFTCLKPEGFRLAQEKGPVVRMEAGKGQSRCVIRIYADLLPSRWPLKELVAQRRAAFAADESYRRRGDPVELTWRPPLVRKGFELCLSGLKAGPVQTRHYLADCRNRRRYEIHVFIAGAPDAWEPSVKAFLAAFRPVRG